MLSCLSIVDMMSFYCYDFLNSISLLLINMLFDLFKFFMRSHMSYYLMLNFEATYAYDISFLLAILTTSSRSFALKSINLRLLRLAAEGFSISLTQEGYSLNNYNPTLFSLKSNLVINLSDSGVYDPIICSTCSLTALRILLARCA